MRTPQEVGLNDPTGLPPLGSRLDFLRVIWALDHALQRSSKRLHATLGVTGPQRLVVQIVGRFPGIAARQLAEILHIHPSTLTGILKRLERQHLITRRPYPRDRRRAFLGLTAKGRQIDLYAAHSIEAAVEEAISDLTPSKIQNAKEVLLKLTESLGPAQNG